MMMITPKSMTALVNNNFGHLPLDKNKTHKKSSTMIIVCSIIMITHRRTINDNHHREGYSRSAIDEIINTNIAF